MTAAQEPPPHVLVVDDDAEVRALLAEYFAGHGLDVTVASGADEARAALAAGRVGLAVVDVVMPGEDGLSLARYIRERLGIAIVMLTAADAPVDRIVGLAVGADDYVVKPFHPRELLVRVRALLRRPPPGDGDPPGEAGGLRIGRFRLDPAARVLHGPEGSAVPVSAAEVALLRALADHPYQSLDRRRLIELAGLDGTGTPERAVDQQICRLRGKIERDPRRPRVLRTVRGCGYMLAPRADEDGG